MSVCWTGLCENEAREDDIFCDACIADSARKLKDRLAKATSIEARCPFCDEGGYDLVGLKSHLRWCAVFDGVESIARPF